MAASFIVVYFQSSAHMEAAYGLAITVTMLMTTTLLTVYLSHYQKVKKYWLAYFSPFLSLLKACFCSFRCKIYAWRHVVVIIAAMILFVMAIWHKSDQLFINILILQILMIIKNKWTNSAKMKLTTFIIRMSFI